MTPLSSQAADDQQVQALYQDHQRWLGAWLRKRLNNIEDTEDIVQEVFLRLLLRPVRTLDSAPKARAYLKVMARNLATDLWRKRQIEQVWLESLANRPEEYAPSAEHQAQVLEALCELDTLLRSLPPKVSRAFMLKNACEMTEAEVAREMGTSPRMVRKFIAQAMLHIMKLELYQESTTGNPPAQADPEPPSSPNPVAQPARKQHPAHEQAHPKR